MEVKYKQTKILFEMIHRKEILHCIKKTKRNKTIQGEIESTAYDDDCNNQKVTNTTNESIRKATKTNSISNDDDDH